MAKFEPSEREILALLLHKVNGEPFPFPCNINFDISIPTMDIYGYKEPWDLFHDVQTYCYTRLKRRKDGCYERSAGKGHWFFYGGETIYDGRKQPVGYVKNMEFVGLGLWYLKEYTLDTKFCCCFKSKYTDFVFCVVKKYTPIYFKDKIYWDVDGFFDEMLRKNSGATPSARPEKACLDLELHL